MAQRGQITDNILMVSRQKLGREISLAELRLMPYLQHIMVNNQKFDYHRLCKHEIAIIEHWDELDWISMVDPDQIWISKYFWDFISEAMWLAYVNYRTEVV